MSLEAIDPQFRLDAEVAPTFVGKNYDIETGEFEVFYNDRTLNNDEWYGPLAMDLDSMKQDDEAPIRLQIARYVYNAVQSSRLKECPMEASKQVLAQMIGIEQSVDMIELMKHEQNLTMMESTHVDPTLSASQIVNILSEDDFDEQFERLSAELAED